MIVLGVLAAFALVGPLLYSVDPNAQRDILETRFLPPFARDLSGRLRWLGTDALGRDLLARMIHGARISLAVGFLAMALSALIGTSVGLVAAMVGGATDRALMALTDSALAMPRLVLLLALVTLWEPSLALVIWVLGLTGWMSLARLTRAEVRGVLATPYALAAESSGVAPWQMAVRHLLPNAMTPLVIITALGVGNAIMLEAGLSFLGLGVPAPAPSWGNMIASGRDALVNAPWVSVAPGMAVVATVLACNLLGDGLRDVLDPKTRGV